MAYKPADIESRLCEVMPVGALCAPLPPDFDMPLAFVTRTGGEQIENVLDAHSVSVDVYAPTWAQANETARMCVDAVRGAGFRLATANVPYDNTDPARPDLARVTFTCRIVERTD